MLTFDQCFDRLIGFEAKYVNDSQDPGGETNWGISKRSYPDLDIKNLTRQQSKDIYLKDFWLRIKANVMHPIVAFQLFDFAVNSGIETAVRYLQRIVGVADDGHWGPVSQAAADRTPDPVILLRLNSNRLNFMTKCKNWDHDGKGWARRIAQNLEYCAEDLLEGNNG